MGRLIRRRSHVRSDDADAAAAGLTLAVMLGAGVTPARAWQHLAETGDAAAARVRDAHADGAPLPAAIAALGGPWTDVATAWSVATSVGAPLAETLRGIAASMRDAQVAADDVRVALAEPAATARLMGWLPLVAVALGAVLGFDTVGVLIGSPLGIACLVTGVVLIALARRWNAHLVRRAADERAVPGMDAELLAIALSGGVSIDRAREVVGAARAVAGADAAGGDASSLDEILALSRAAGVPAVELLRASAELERHRARVEARLRAARLSSRLLLPLGVCTLPAFLLLGVVPMFLSVVSSSELTLP
ncbi:type II secretion system F family protein [Microbacterium sp.]|jgi:tight adherence protein B|uniref:type II secretion system F family protein n=1 Tax=Microbacterium sp. TaxID=51671 RepID=UPI002CD1CC94|nr:type II secretion system F family protein [Microbacterium sp.]HWL77700.1 type II secretion system F family protein [Microbacterium sp.]